MNFAFRGGTQVSILLTALLLTSCRSRSVVDARPHPSPLPQEREDHPQPLKRSVLESNEGKAAVAKKSSASLGSLGPNSLSTGERAGVRASVSSDLSPHRYEFKQPHMGTLFIITLFAPDEAKAREASDAAFAKIVALDRMMTDYDPESELMRLCRKPVGQPVHVSDELFDILQKSQRVAELTDGAFDVTIGPVVRLWRRARRTETLPPAEALTQAREAVGYEKLKLDSRHKTVTLTVPNMQLDLGGIAKGYAAEKTLGVLKNHGINRALVAASGDIAAGDPPPDEPGWRVAIGAMDPNPSTQRAPQNAVCNLLSHVGQKVVRDDFAKTILLKNAAVSTSGDAEQFVEIGGQRYSHIVDPRTGVGLTERVQVSIIAKRATDTDSFATAVSVLGVERGLVLVEAQPGMAAFILRRRGEATEVFGSSKWKKIQPRSR